MEKDIYMYYGDRGLARKLMNIFVDRPLKFRVYTRQINEDVNSRYTLYDNNTFMMNNLLFSVFIILFISFSNLFGQEDVVEQNRKLKLYEVHPMLEDELDKILCNCNSALKEGVIRGFFVQCVKKKEGDFTIVSPLFYEDFFSEKLPLVGLSLVKGIPFVISNSYALDSLIKPLDEEFEFKYYLFKDISTRYLDFPEYPLNKEIVIDHKNSKFIFLYCIKP